METEASEEKTVSETPFKKPLLVGKIGKFPKRIKPVSIPEPEPTPEENVTSSASIPDEVDPPPADEKPQDLVKPAPYTPPPWSTQPQTGSDDFILEVLKNGRIIETVNLMSKPFWIFGRLPSCDVCMQHPTISRYHAVLQYRADADKTGFYIYDLESTHGTFLNKNRLKPRSYVRMHVGHMLKLGCSTRTYILSGPADDAEEESTLSVTELKALREEELRRRQQLQIDEEEKRKKKEENGIDWGLGEDAEEETDLSENPFAQTNNEELYLDNPKKALRGFFEREGLELEYDCTEQGIGQFSCKVELPIDDENGRPVCAEVIHKGKKKEAVVQCALEACRILDRHGLLRQATHESRKRKPKNWEENDYYDSDDDTFLDRTGAIEKKREMRMKAKVPQKAETYETLIVKEKAMNDRIKRLEVDLRKCQAKLVSESGFSESEVDTLDSYMMELKESKPSKQSVNKLKAEILKLKQEHANVIKLVNITKPASLPPLTADYSVTNSSETNKKQLPLFGKRKKIKLQVPQQSVVRNLDEEDEEEEELDEAESETTKETKTRIEEKKREIEEKPVEEDKKTEEEMRRELERRRKRNQKRIQQKQERAEMQKQQGYIEDASKEDYNMWVPPSGQTGDGRTTLNDKFGY